MVLVVFGLSVAITMVGVWLTCEQLLRLSSFNYLMYRLLRKGKADIYLRDDSDREHWQHAAISHCDCTHCTHSTSTRCQWFTKLLPKSEILRSWCSTYC
eukprot:COSAG02_NODE_2397_length_8951_cov_3.254406_3_plen_99_part_00